MNKNALMFNLHVEDKSNMSFYSMLYFALETLEKVYDGTFDVVVYYKTKNFEFKKEFHLGGYNIYRQFLFPKWYALQKTFELGYEKVFMIDNDIIFCDNPSSMFEKYGNKNVAHIGADGWEQKQGGFRPILERVGIASGNEIILREAIHPLNTFFERAVEHRIKLIKKSEEMMKNGQISERIYNNFKFFSEQFAGNFALQDPYDPNNIPEGKEFVEIQREDLVTPDESNYLNSDRLNNPYYCLNIENNIIRITNIKTKIIHYSSSASPLYIPKKLFTTELIKYSQGEVITNLKNRIKKLNG